MKTHFTTKRKFEVTSKADVGVFKVYLETSSWGKDTCPFELEFPYLTVPDMIKDKLVYHFLKAYRPT